MYDAAPISNLTGFRGLAVSDMMILAGDTFRRLDNGLHLRVGGTLPSEDPYRYHALGQSVRNDLPRRRFSWWPTTTSGLRPLLIQQNDGRAVQRDAGKAVHRHRQPVGIASYNDKLLVINPDRQMFDYMYDGNSATDRRTLSNSIPAGAAALTFHGDLLLVGSPGLVSAYTYDERGRHRNGGSVLKARHTRTDGRIR